jgi:hypothetical protein
VVDRVEVKSEALYNEDNQGDARFHLWAEAFDKGMGAAMLGLGPGPHLTKKAWKRSPPYKFESHNTPLELFTQGGLLALLAIAGSTRRCFSRPRELSFRLWRRSLAPSSYSACSTSSSAIQSSGSESPSASWKLPPSRGSRLVENTRM